MAKEEKKDEGGKGKGKKLHLHRIVTEEAEDGSHVHHHTYKKKRGDPMEMPERRNVATSANADEAGQHVQEQFAQNEPPQQAQGGGDPEEEAEAGAQPMPGAGAPAAGA